MTVNNDTTNKIIKETKEKVEKGILNGTWQYSYSLECGCDEEGNESESYGIFGKAINGEHTVAIYIDTAGQSEYSFAIRRGEQTTYEDKDCAEDLYYYAKSTFDLLHNCLYTWQNAQSEAQSEFVVSSLPD